ncbi:MAG: ABC transporter permease subunit [Acetobacteraceae bacterium]|nr:ABC transporter permease subunit [Acetobacteraceae bacterium]
MLWWFVAELADTPRLFPSPAGVIAVWWRELFSGALPANIGITLARVILAFIISMILGTSAGYVTGRSPRVNAWLDPWLIVALNLPVLVVVVLIYIWVGLNETAAILSVVIAKTPAIMVTVREGARSLRPDLEDLARVYRIPPLRRLRAIVLPQLAPFIVAAARAGLSITWKIVLIVELLGRPNGVGFVLNLFFQNFDVAGILAYGLTFAGMMLFAEAALLQRWERRAFAWRSAA